VQGKIKEGVHSKAGLVIEECDETHFWLELLDTQVNGNREAVEQLTKQANELVSIFVASRLTAEKSLRKPNRQSSIGNRQ
jgi:acetolactate synthase small subunit